MIQDSYAEEANDTAADGAGICWRDSEGWGPDGCRCAKRPVLVPRTVRWRYIRRAHQEPVIWMRVSFASSAGAQKADSVGAGVPDWVAVFVREPERSQLLGDCRHNAAPTEGRPS